LDYYDNVDVSVNSACLRKIYYSRNTLTMGAREVLAVHPNRE